MADPFVALASGADASVRETLPLLSEYGYDFEKHRFRYDENGNNITVTEDEALKVWIYKALMTERYRVYTADQICQNIREGLVVNPYIARINRVDVEKREKDDLFILVDVTSIYSDESITVAAERSLA